MDERHAATWSRHHRDPWLLLNGGTADSSRKTVDTWPRNAAFEHARHDLDRLVDDSRALDLPVPSDAARRSLQAILRDVLATNSVFPTITFDPSDEILMAEWRAGSRRIEIEVAGDGSELFTIVSRRGIPVYQGKSATRLRLHLRDLTSAVVALNPRWRSLFAARR